MRRPAFGEARRGRVSAARGRIGVRDAKTLQRLDTWDSHGIEPHQLLVDRQGALMIANGGIPRTLADKKFDLERMESSLVRLDGRSGKLLRRWQLADPRLSGRHCRSQRRLRAIQ